MQPTSRPALHAVLASSLVALVLIGASPALAVLGDCGQPVSDGDGPVAGDCLFVLKAAVSLIECEGCLCDLDNNTLVAVTDALACLRDAVGIGGIVFNCPECTIQGHTDKDDSVEAPPVISVDPGTPGGGSPATVTVDAPGATAISLVATGDGCGDFSTHQTSSGLLEVVATVADFGLCDLEATVTGGSDAGVQLARFEVAPVDLALPAVEVIGGVFTPGALPVPNGAADAPGIGSIVAPGALINGGTAEVRIQLADPTLAGNVTHALVQTPTAAGFAGHWIAPVILEGDEIIVQLRLDADFAAPGSLAEQWRFGLQRQAIVNPFNVIFELVDIFGNIGSQLAQAFVTQEVGATGDVQVSLSWDTLTDVDLHLIEPSLAEIYWGTPTSPAGGTLDLDSNAGCAIDGVNNENITYSSGAPAGDYIVRVDFWDGCGDLPANYVVTVRNCGQTEIFNGFFAAGSHDQGGAGSGVEITRFNSSCDARVRGKATYEDFAQTKTGLATSSTMMPIRFAQVEIRRASDDAVIAMGDTRQDGMFDIRFVNDGDPGYYVLVKAKQDSTSLKQQVENSAGTIYTIRSMGTIDEEMEPDKTGVMIEAKQAMSGPAPAFNIFDVGVMGASLLKRTMGVTPKRIRWQWTSGQRGACSSNVSCYFKSSKKISVLSIPADRDEYDDLVLLHEYGHFFQNEYSRSDSPGGSHSSRSRVDPQLAWGEGSATFFGNLAKNTPLYLDTIQTGIGVRTDLEKLSANIPRGTSNGNQNGNLSEALVAAVMWDLADSTNESKDTLTNENAVFSSLRYLGSAKFADRGTAGADLVDFLDGWFCNGHGNRGDASKGVQGNAVGIHQFNYDFAAVPSCK